MTSEPQAENIKVELLKKMANLPDQPDPTRINLYVHVGDDTTMEWNTDLDDDPFLMILLGHGVSIVLPPEAVKQWAEGLAYHSAMFNKIQEEKTDGQT